MEHTLAILEINLWLIGVIDAMTPVTRALVALVSRDHVMCLLCSKLPTSFETGR